MLAAQYVKQGVRNGRASVRPSVCLSHRSTLMRCTAGLLLSVVWAGDIDRKRRAPAPNSNGAAVRRSAANAGSVMLTAELTTLNTDRCFRCSAVRVCLCGHNRQHYKNGQTQRGVGLCVLPGDRPS